jgi:hypothetical protein
MNKLNLFLGSLILPLIFFRILVFLKDGRVSFLRHITGLSVHHYHYGIILLTMAVILLIFYKISSLTIILAGLGLGSTLDSFISSLFPSINRAQEIVNYNLNLIPTIVLFVGVIFLIIIIQNKKN